MIKKREIWYDDNDEPVYYETKNPLFTELPDYHFDRDEMSKVFTSGFEDWVWEHMNRYGFDFFITKNEDTIYIIHFPSGTIVSWYKHMGRANQCNKNLTIEDLKEFKKMLLEDFGYEEVSND